MFLRGIERCLALGRSAIVLVPEIALAPQTAGRVSARFGPRVAVLHSALAAGERAAEYARIVRGEATIVIGPRSALFAPVADLGLIVIDEEHEAAYKQDSDPRYDARAIAVLRARRHGAAVLLATATPRPEAWRPLERIELPGRIGGRLPPVDIVDLRRDGAYPISRPLHAALGAIADEGGRAVLLLNRRGEAPALHCRSCGVTFGCPDCDVALTLHRNPAALLCHHCGRRERIPRACPTCHAVDIARIGAGTERLEELIAETFPDLVVMRLDADSTSRRGTLEEVLERFGSTDRAVLVGTQLVAKGHDFPSVRLAAAIDADVGLAQPDFRAEERTFSLLVQLAGRAGREGSGGRVIVQSWEPESRVVRLAARHAVAEFLDGELARRELLAYPPFRRIVRVLVTAPSAHAADGVLRDAGRRRPAAPGGRRHPRPRAVAPAARPGPRAPAGEDGPGAARSGRAGRPGGPAGGRVPQGVGDGRRRRGSADPLAAYGDRRRPSVCGLSRGSDPNRRFSGVRPRVQDTRGRRADRATCAGCAYSVADKACSAGRGLSD